MSSVLHREVVISHREYLESRLALKLLEESDVVGIVDRVSFSILNIIEKSTSTFRSIVERKFQKLCHELYSIDYFASLRREYYTVDQLIKDIKSVLSDPNNRLGAMLIHGLFTRYLSDELIAKHPELFNSELTPGWKSDIQQVLFSSRFYETEKRGRKKAQHKVTSRPTLSASRTGTYLSLMKKFLEDEQQAEVTLQQESEHKRAVDEFDVDTESTIVVQAQKQRLPIGTGYSGHTGTALLTFYILGLKDDLDLVNYTLATFSLLNLAGAHSFHEVMLSAVPFGLPYKQGSYQSVLAHLTPQSREVREFVDELDSSTRFTDRVMPERSISTIQNGTALIKSIRFDGTDFSYWDYILHQVKYPQFYRPVKRESRIQVDRSRAYNPLTGIWHNRTPREHRGSYQNTHFTKKMSTTLLPKSGEIQHFESYSSLNLGLVMDLDQCHLKGEKYFFASDVSSNEKPWLAVKSDGPPKSLGRDGLIAHVNSSHQTQHNEVLVGLQESAITAIYITQNDVDHLTAALALKARVVQKLNLILPIMIITGESQPYVMSDAEILKKVLEYKSTGLLTKVHKKQVSYFLKYFKQLRTADSDFEFIRREPESIPTSVVAEVMMHGDNLSFEHMMTLTESVDLLQIIKVQLISDTSKKEIEIPVYALMLIAGNEKLMPTILQHLSKKDYKREQTMVEALANEIYNGVEKIQIFHGVEFTSEQFTTLFEKMNSTTPIYQIRSRL